MTGQRCTSEYAELVRAVSQALYDEDPDGVGSSIDAPADEYDDLAHQLASDLVVARSPEEAGHFVTELFVSAAPSLIERIWLALQRYRATPPRGG